MSLERIISAVIGLAAFVVAHALIASEILRATLTPNPLIRPWFTNSTGSVLVTAAVVAVAAFARGVGAMDRGSAMGRGVTVGIGALIAMVALMALNGFGDLAPIAVAVGGAILLAAGAAGGSIGALRKSA